jgi:transcriptional regulator with XRE-family HTH domain
MQTGSSVAISTVSKWLSGEALPANGNMEVVARICNVSPDWLRSGEEAPSYET